MLQCCALNRAFITKLIFPQSISQSHWRKSCPLPARKEVHQSLAPIRNLQTLVTHRETQPCIPYGNITSFPGDFALENKGIGEQRPPGKLSGTNFPCWSRANLGMAIREPEIISPSPRDMIFMRCSVLFCYTTLARPIFDLINKFKHICRCTYL